MWFGANKLLKYTPAAKGAASVGQPNRRFALACLPLSKALSVMGDMPNFIKFIFIAIPTHIGVLMSIRDYGEVERVAFSGWVTFIEWESRNHGMPLIEISRKNGTKVKFSSTRIILDSTQLKVGDSISKVRDSYSCTINEQLVPCIK